MSGTIDNIRAKFKRTFSHKDKEVDFDNVDEADEETHGMVNKELESAEKDEKYPEGRPGSLLNRMISYGNKKTDDELARDRATYESRLAQGSSTGAPSAAPASAAPATGAYSVVDSGAAGHHGHGHHDASAGGLSGDGGASASAGGTSAGGSSGGA